MVPFDLALPMASSRLSWAFALAWPLVAAPTYQVGCECGGLWPRHTVDSPDAGDDAGSDDADVDSGQDGGDDAGPGTDAGADAGGDGGDDAGLADGGFDAGPPDSGADAGPPDAGIDAGPPDSGADAGPPDSGLDAGPPDAGVAFQLAITTAALTLIDGACVGPVSFELRDSSGNPVTAGQATTVAFDVSPLGPVSLFSDSGCTSSAASATLAIGASGGDLYVRGTAPGAALLTLSSSGLASVSQTETVLAVARGGSCVLPAGVTSVACPIAPPQLDTSHTMLFFAATGVDSWPTYGEVRCVLTGPSAVTCDRETSGTVLGIQWQTLEPASGVQVQHLSYSCADVTAFSVTVQPVILSSAFVLGSHHADGSLFNDDDFITRELATSTRVDIVTGTGDPCGIQGGTPLSGALEVVEVSGASVTRGVTGQMTTQSLVVSGLTAVDPTSTALLFSERVYQMADSICDHGVRGEMTSPTSISFTRGQGSSVGSCLDSTVQAIAWERVDFGARARVVPFTVALDAGVATATAGIASVDSTRTVLFSTNVTLNGQTLGEGGFNGSGAAGEQSATFNLTSPTQVTLDRALSSGPAKFTGQAVEWVP